ncbi:hypothetical protein [Aureimonas sp. AU40]|uniref:hypothetical protein n=1 Tax=Aureimonas sp. AU40 TaxID=1637747 RepID=UPI000A678977|nr:hypothetical protein [Aureimonas sp. AU40]
MAEVSELDKACIDVLRDYSLVERRLAWLLAALLEIKSDDGARILEIVRGNDTRYKLIGEFVRTKAPDFAPFWRQMRRALKVVDEGRNKVAHWHAIADHGEIAGGSATSTPALKLVPPTDVFVDNDIALSVEDISELSRACRHATRVLMFFFLTVRWEVQNPDAEKYLLRDIFLEPFPDQFLGDMFQRIAEAHARLPEAPHQSAEAGG